MNKAYSTLLIQGVELNLHLGWPKEERINRQKILLDIEIHFPQPPYACITDNLNNTVCYFTLINEIQEKINNQQFRLIEYLGSEIFHLIKPLLPAKTKIQVKITKHPDIKGLTGCVAFSYGNE